MLLFFLACSGDEGWSSAEDCAALSAGAARDKCWSVHAVEVFRTDPERGVRIVEEQVSDPQIRDFIWLQVTREVDPGSDQYCDRIQESILQERCKILVRRPHIKREGCFAPARSDAACDSSCGDIPDGTCLSSRLKLSDHVIPEAHLDDVKSVLRSKSGQIRFCHEQLRYDCPCLTETLQIAATIEAGRIVAVETGEGELAACASRKIRGWRFPEAVSGALGFTASVSVAPVGEELDHPQ